MVDFITWAKRNFWDKRASDNRYQLTSDGAVAGGYTLTLGSDVEITGDYTLTLGGDSTVNGSLVGSMTGSGTVATGGYTLTVPATGTAALRGTANTFSADQTIEDNQLVLIGTAELVNMYNTSGGSLLAQMFHSALVLYSRDTGAGADGPFVQISRNNNGTTPVAGHLTLVNKNGSSGYLWNDANGDLRWNTGKPAAGDTNGVIAGDISSFAAAKDIDVDLSSIQEVLDRILAGAESVRRFAYKSGRYGGQKLEGVIIDDAPDYGVDRDTEHPHGKALNQVTIIGDLLRAVAYLSERVKQLEDA